MKEYTFVIKQIKINDDGHDNRIKNENKVLSRIHD